MLFQLISLLNVELRFDIVSYANGPLGHRTSHLYVVFERSINVLYSHGRYQIDFEVISVVLLRLLPADVLILIKWTELPLNVFPIHKSKASICMLRS
jgi:hypothetical protein